MQFCVAIDFSSQECARICPLLDLFWVCVFVAQWTVFEASWRHPQTVSYAEHGRTFLNQSREAARKLSGL